MAQHDYVVDNQTLSGANIRGDVNAVLAAIATSNSGPVAPSITYPYQDWVDASTSPPTLRIRNAANTAWVTPPTSVAYYRVAGDTDDTASFSRAAKAAPALVNIHGPGAALPRALMCRVLVPAGTYTLSSEVDTGNRDVTWEIDQGAIVNGYFYLNGQVIRVGERQAGFHHGSTDYACGYSIKANSDLAEGAPVLGIESASDLSAYPDRDSVALYVDNLAPAANVSVNTATYTATTATIAAQSAATVLRYRRGMIIDTKHSPKWSGIVDSWNSDGSVIAVTGWYRFGGSAGTPASGTGCAINGFTKVWSVNSNVFLVSDSYATQATGFELGAFNNKGVLDYAAKTNYVWGFDSVNLGTYEGAAAFIARNSPAAKWFRGFECEDASQVAFHVGGNPTSGFWSEQLSGTPFRFSRSGVDYFSVDFNGNVKAAGVLQSDAANGAAALGSRNAASTPFINFYSSGVTSDFDSRLIANGGSPTSGAGGLTVVAAAGIRFAGSIYPDTDNTLTAGKAANRWSVVYAGTGAINTSDGREKQDIEKLTAAEKRVARSLPALIRRYKLKDAVEAKGSSARWHFGIIAQDVIEAFSAEGLDASDYGVLCHDQWDESPEIRDGDGLIIQQHQSAGDRYGIRYEELHAFIISAL